MKSNQLFSVSLAVKIQLPENVNPDELELWSTDDGIELYLPDGSGGCKEIFKAYRSEVTDIFHVESID
ncbi:MAG: hypothetical protein GY804_03910 [Alphaproteobacteria bacterium]|nr:hypothetical protein [Alphaproteobacteria bacterium]